MSKLIGRVFATESCPNTPDTFNFWTEFNSSVGIGTIVKVTVPQPSERNFGTANATEWDTYGIVIEDIPI
jgi:uncharacterized protein